MHRQIKKKKEKKEGTARSLTQVSMQEKLADLHFYAPQNMTSQRGSPKKCKMWNVQDASCMQLFFGAQTLQRVAFFPSPSIIFYYPWINLGVTRQ